MSEYSDNDGEHSQGQDEEPLDKSFDSAGSKRGRPKIQEKWTRVIRMQEQGNTKYRIHDIGPDLLLADAMPLAPR